jgi:hypothetical protein
MPIFSEEYQIFSEEYQVKSRDILKGSSQYSIYQMVDRHFPL